MFKKNLWISILACLVMVGCSDDQKQEGLCPDGALKTEPGACGCDKPDVDENNNGVVDCKETPEDEDLCPDDPDKKQPGACGCGTPDVDENSNGVIDCLETSDDKDLCPADPDKVQPGICGCGIPDVDADDNGIMDCLEAPEDDDLCPDDPDKLKPGICGCGVPDADGNDNGVIDCIEATDEDLCPEDPDKKQPGVCGCGVPDIDGNDNGVIDCLEPKDLCPDDPNKMEPGACGCGAVDFDQDKDSVADCIDVCPYDATSYDAYAGDDLIGQIDEKAAKLRDEILNTKDEIDLSKKTNVYYVANNGSDENDGKSPDKAFATVKKANAVAVAGDAVLFNRGDIFRGAWKASAGVTYAAYGSGRKPRIYGSPENGADPDKWELVDEKNHIWKYKKTFSPDIGGVIFNEGEAHGYKEIPTWNIAEKKFVLRNNTTAEFKMSEQLDSDLEFFWDGCDKLTSANVPDVNSSTGNLYVRSDKGNPGTRFKSIEFNPRYNAISVGGNDDVTIDNLAIMYTGSHGVGAGDHPDNLVVTNCEIAWIGGGIQYYAEEDGHVVRYGNGIEIYGGCDKYFVDHNWVHECYDAGVTHQLSKVGDKETHMNNITYSNNLLEYNVYNVEYFISVVNEGNNSLMENVDISNNIMRFAGYGWGHQRPDKGSAAHIKSWTSSNPARNFKIHDNIFDRSRYYTFHVYTDPRFGEESIPKLGSNMYVQDMGASFGIFGNVSTSHTYTCALIEQMSQESVPYSDKTGKLYYATESRIAEKVDCPDEVRSSNPEICGCDMTSDSDGDKTVDCKDFCPSAATSYEVLMDEPALDAMDAEIRTRREAILNAKDELSLDGYTVYYISNKGSDDNDGKTPEKAVKNLSKVHYSCGSKCAFLFERGGEYSLEMTAKSDAIYAAYGTGNKPILTRGRNASDPALWTEIDAEHHIWKYAEDVTNAGTIVFDDIEAASLVKLNWDIAGKKLVTEARTEFDSAKDLNRNLAFAVVASSELAESGVPNASKATGPLYLRSDRGNPAELYKSVWITNVGRVMHLSSEQKNVVFDNLALKYSGSAAIGGNTKPLSNITFSHCDIGWNGGAVSNFSTTSGNASRSAEAVFMGSPLDNIKMVDNYFHDNYGNSLSLYFTGVGDNDIKLQNIEVSGNVFERCFTGLYYALADVSAANQAAMIKDMSIKDNIFTKTGTGWSYAQRTDKTNSAHITTSGGRSNPANNLVIQNNIFDRAANVSLAIQKTSSNGSLPKLEGNTFIQRFNSYLGVFSQTGSSNISYTCSLINRFASTIYDMQDEKVKVRFVVE